MEGVGDWDYHPISIKVADRARPSLSSYTPRGTTKASAKIQQNCVVQPAQKNAPFQEHQTKCRISQGSGSYKAPKSTWRWEFRNKKPFFGAFLVSCLDVSFFYKLEVGILKIKKESEKASFLGILGLSFVCLGLWFLDILSYKLCRN